jgi:hypothetical protein
MPKSKKPSLSGSKPLSGSKSLVENTSSQVTKFFHTEFLFFLLKLFLMILVGILLSSLMGGLLFRWPKSGDVIAKTNEPLQPVTTVCRGFQRETYGSSPEGIIGLGEVHRRNPKGLFECLQKIGVKEGDRVLLETAAGDGAVDCGITDATYSPLKDMGVTCFGFDKPFDASPDKISLHAYQMLESFLYQADISSFIRAAITVPVPNQVGVLTMKLTEYRNFILRETKPHPAGKFIPTYEFFHQEVLSKFAQLSAKFIDTVSKSPTLLQGKEIVYKKREATTVKKNKLSARTRMASGEDSVNGVMVKTINKHRKALPATNRLFVIAGDQHFSDKNTELPRVEGGMTIYRVYM